MSRALTLSLAGVLALFSVFVYFVSIQPESARGSIIQGFEYNSTSTAANSLYGAQTASEVLLKTGAGSLAQVTITGANTGVLNFYNATTSNVNLRTGNTPTSTILIASFPASAAAETYIFDAQFTTGLIYVLEDGNLPTTTIMWR